VVGTSADFSALRIKQPFQVHSQALRLREADIQRTLHVFHVSSADFRTPEARTQSFRQ
jgi:hypothetical protein